MLAMFAPMSFSQTRGYEKSLELTGGVGLSEYTKYSVGVSMINGYRVNPHFFAGVGIGFKYSNMLYYKSIGDGDSYDSIDGKYLVQPWLRLKGNLTDSKLSPFVTLDAGWTFDVGQNPNKNAKGLFFEPQIGMDVRLSGKQAFYFSLGANLQDYSYTVFNVGSREPGSHENRFYVGVLSLHVGFKF